MVTRNNWVLHAYIYQHISTVKENSLLREENKAVHLITTENYYQNICLMLFFILLDWVYCLCGLPWWLRGSSVCLRYGRPGFDPWVRKIPWRSKWQPTPVFLPGESHGQRSLVGYSPRGCKESDMTERLHFHFSLSLSLPLVHYKKHCTIFSPPTDKSEKVQSEHKIGPIISLAYYRITD